MDVVRDHDRGHAQSLLKASDQVVDRVGRDRVQPGRRLVVEDPLGRESDCAGQSDPLAHPARQVGRHQILDVLELDQSQHLDDPVPDLVLVPVGVLAQRERHVVLHVHRIEQRSGLKQHPDLLARFDQLLLAEARDLLAIDPDLACIGMMQADRVAQQHRLSGPRSAQHDHGLAALDLQVHATEHLLVAERLVQVDVANERFGRHRHSTMMNSLVRKKSDTMTEIDETTTVFVVALPTPSAPPLALRPL